jgi:hypothetical protein
MKPPIEALLPTPRAIDVRRAREIPGVFANARIEDRILNTMRANIAQYRAYLRPLFPKMPTEVLNARCKPSISDEFGGFNTLTRALQAKIMFETVAHCSLMNIESARSCVPAAQNEPKNARNPGLSESSRQTATYSFISCSNVQ